ncbi:efflux RND transporter permease subunit [Gloeobacter kilaueensis]|uniref:Heavy metal efflux pump, CzcA family n=1 Tax=Gloeobacter kilaueensis (strain ATCC BAA-2537 / CCAP 1431/1 / ULC 316 / JS1) TaxID=1183438 RepID=U5QMG3_GLOK1|nr:CusA/CzcA family heavy metal efflux RND transporter [Gloeobacter kilaueensis]AGY60111.1 heavy metal efflux pump, CzcA family [Gloeobacter kilaueensis JS1]
MATDWQDDDDREGAASAQREGWLEKAVRGALNARIVVLAGAALACLVGLYSFLNLRVDAVPDISNIQVTVSTNAYGLAPQEVEQYVTYPVELSLQGMPRLTQLRSISKYALSQVTAVFEDGTDIYWARQQVSERLKGAQDQMPKGEIKVELGPIATGLGEIYQFELRGSGYSPMQLRDILDWQIIPALRSVPGVDAVQSMGGDAREYQVWLEAEKLHGYNLSPSAVMAALERNNANAGGGYAIENGNQILLRAEGLLRSPTDIGNVIVRRTAKGSVRVQDLGTVVIGKKLAQSIVTQNGQGETVIGIVVMRKGENSAQVVERVKRRLEALKPSLPPNIEVIAFYDRSVLIERTIDTVWHNLAEGAVLVLVVLFVLLGNWRGGAIAALAIPLSLLGAVTFLSWTNTSGNLLSLGALDFGILIDGSVVMVENILRRLGEEKPKPAQRLKVVAAASVEVARPVLFAVLIITVVYLPILLLTGVAGKTFQPMALTVVFGLLTALFIALFITPATAYFLITKIPEEKETRPMAALRRLYNVLLSWCTARPRTVGSAAFALFGASLLCLPFLGSEFIPTLKEGSTVLTVNRAISASLPEAARQTTLIEQVVRSFAEVRTVVSRTGHSEQAFDPMGPDETDVFIVYHPQDTWKRFHTQAELEDAIAARLAQAVPGATIAFSQPIEQRMNELVAGVKGDVGIRIFGPDLTQLAKLGNRVAAVVAKVPGASDIKVQQVGGLPVVSARLNRRAMLAYGVDADEAMDTVLAAVDGKTVGTIFQGKPRYDLVVRFAPDSLGRPESLASLPVGSLTGELVPLAQLATVRRYEGAAQISHLEGDRNLTVQLNVHGRDLGSFVAAAQEAVNTQVVLPTGYRLEWGGQFENLQQAQARLTVLVPVALALIFLLLYTSFGSFRPGALIFLNIPLALSGGLFALALRGMPLSVTAGVGFIALFGVAVLNGVVLVSTIRRLEQVDCLSPAAAAAEGARQRLRPVLMTALVASLGFVPMALATSVGAEVQRPLATVVIGGLITSTVLTLLVLPTLYPLVCKRPARLARQLERQKVS